ncbi:hypothetical protein C2S52_005734 [Perilla frutescens var. hirtella]|nr:hypothetical protein C2S52_005734 [Perilla frutescens var. hirtella]
MADAAEVILSAIEQLDSLLLQKPDLPVDDGAKLRSLRSEKKDLLVGMMKVWENSREMLYRLLVWVADPWDAEEEEVDNGDMDEMWEEVFNFLGEMEDLWELEYCWEELHSLAVEMMDPDIDRGRLFCLAVEMADLWKEGKGKLNKEKLYSWLAVKTDLWEEEKLFDLLNDMTCIEGPVERKELFEKDWEYVEGVRNDLRLILNKLEDEGSSHGHLHYFMSDVVEMTDDVRLLVHLKDSDPFILFLQIFHRSSMKRRSRVLRIKPIHGLLRETEKRVWKLGADETSQINNVRDEVVGTSPSYSESDHHVFIDSKRDDMVIEKMENKSLQQMLHQHLQDKPYVLVLDDVSEETYLQYVFFRALPQDKRSRLLFTTRSHQIRCKPYADCEHKMKNLDGDKSWQLLLQTALRSDEKFPKQLENKGREMLMRKCGGLPLAIKEVGRQWTEKRRSGSEWKELVVEESFMNLELAETLVAMEWTYLNMDPEVKPCFLRLAFFKEGTIVRTKKLIHIWTAGGLLEDQSELGYEDLREQTIIEEVDETKTSHLFRINVHFHRLSITKAVDEIGYEILRQDGSNRASHEPCHHRVIHCSRDDKSNYNCSSTNQDEHLVSLFFHGGGGYSSVCHPSYWKHFEQLKVLDMEGYGLKILPETIGDLTELRYLGLRNNYIQELPQSLRCLKIIEVLDIAQNFMVEVPDILWEMDCLRHLYMSDIICQKPLKINALMNLETLTYISVDDWTYEVSDMKNKMTSLLRLGIEEVDENSNVSKLFASLAELEYLDCLILRGFRFRSMPSFDELGLLQGLTELKLEGRLTKLPSANNFPRMLQKLVLVNSCLDEDPIPILEKLLELHNLKLENAYTGQQMVISNEGFHGLDSLIIRELWNLRNIVKFGEGGMWNFKRSEINSCPHLETVPQEIFSRLDPLRSQSLKCATP